MQILHRYIIIFITLTGIHSGFTQQWQHMSPMQTARKGMAAVVLDEKIWVIGGAIMEHHALKSVDMYDPATDTWSSSVPDLKYARENCTARVWDGKIYVFGGRFGHQTISAVEMYDPASATWQIVSQMPTPRYGAASVVADSAIWLIGGSSGHDNSPSDLVEKYYPAENRWEQLPARLTIARSDPMAAALDGEIFVFGGYFYGPLGNYEKYDPATNAWQAVGNLLYSAASSGCVAYKNQVWIIGGMGQSGAMKNVQIFQLGDGSYEWTEGPTLDEPRRETAAAVVNNKLYVIGGRGTKNWQTLNSIAVFDITTDVKSLPSAQPSEFVLLQNYPNPFTTRTTFLLRLPARDNIELTVYDILGRKIEKVFQGALPAGEFQFHFSPAVSRLPSGLYFVRLRGEKFNSVQKIHLLK